MMSLIAGFTGRFIKKARKNHMAQAYCPKCKIKQEINNPESVVFKNGMPATKGTCAVCGTNVSVINKKNT